MRIKPEILKEFLYNDSMELKVGQHIEFIVRGLTFRGVVQIDYPRAHYIGLLGEFNNSLVYWVYGEDYKDTVSSIYGYKATEGWPEAKTMTDLKRLLKDLMKRGVEIYLM